MGEKARLIDLWMVVFCDEESWMEMEEKEWSRGDFIYMNVGEKEWSVCLQRGEYLWKFGLVNTSCLP